MKRLNMILFSLVALALPTLAFAQVVTEPVASKGNIPLGPVIAVGTAIVGAAGALMGLLPKGWKTYVNLAVGVGVAGLSGLTTLADSAPNATLLAVVIAFVGAAIGRYKTTPPTL